MSFRLFSCLKDIWWLRHLVLKSAAVRPTYVSVVPVTPLVVTVAWYTISFCKHSPSNGHSFSFQQLHIFWGWFSSGFWAFSRMALLCNHQMSFKHEKRRNDTELSKYLWKLKEKKEGYSISRKITAKAKAYSNTTKCCNICITEKFFILSDPQMATLNKRNELISNCRRRRKYILKYSWNFVYCIISARRFFEFIN